MSTCAKIFKEVNTHKATESVSTVLQRKFPPKLKDKGIFNIFVTIGDTKVEKGMLDLGANINLIPYSIYIQLSLGDLQPSTMFLRLADHSFKYPRGIVEDILVQMDKLIIPTDFVFLDMEDALIHDRELLILLGRPFMATSGTMVDVKNGKLRMTVLDETVEFEVFDSVSYPSNFYDCFSIDAFESVVFTNIVQDEVKGKFEAALTLESNGYEDCVVSYPSWSCSVISLIGGAALVGLRGSNGSKLVPSISSPPNLELKPPPSTFKYAYLGEHELWSRWFGTFKVTQAFSNGVVELKNLITRPTFKVNGQRVRPYLESIPAAQVVDSIDLIKPYTLHFVSPRH